MYFLLFLVGVISLDSDAFHRVYSNLQVFNTSEKEEIILVQDSSWLFLFDVSFIVFIIGGVILHIVVVRISGSVFTLQYLCMTDFPHLTL